MAQSSNTPPSVSVLTAVFDPDPAHLAACLRSVRQQTFPGWEHIIVNDGSTDPAIAALLDAHARADERVTVVHRAEQGGIVAASADALAGATGEFVALLDHDDVIEPHALAAMVGQLRAGADVAYSDHDFIRPDGRLIDPCYKPDFSPERLRNQNYITHFLAARRSLVERVGGFRDGFDGAQDHDLVLRLTEVAEQVAHVPEVLYHWRQAPTSVSSSSANKPWAFDAGRRAVEDHCARVGITASVEATDHEGCYRLRRSLTATPLVSVIIPTRGSAGRIWGATRAYVVDAVRSIVEHSTYQHLEFVVVVDDETPVAVTQALHDIAGDRLELVAYSEPFNFSAKINAGASAARGDLFLLLNDDTELIDPASIEVMVAHLDVADVGMVGAKLLFSDGTLQHGGHVYHHDLMHACLGWPGDSPGPWPLRPLAVERESSGVTAAAALVRRSAFEAVGGFATELPLNYNDVDFSLKIRADGHRIVWTPYATWYHFESRTRHSEVLPAEYAFVNDRWHFEINNDPYYNPNLQPDRHDWLERPMRSGAPAVQTRPNLLRRAASRVTSGSAP
jgi:glycosyltransferase involved in cell wall biosynthesis